MNAARIEQFFGTELPLLMGAEGLAHGPRAIVAFEIPPVGAWTLTLGDSPTLEAGVPASADLFLTFRAEVFASLLAGQAPTPGRGFAAAGDHALLGRLIQLIQGPAKGPVGVRSRSH